MNTSVLGLPFKLPPPNLCHVRSVDIPSIS